MCLYARDLRISEGEHIQRIRHRSTSRIKIRRAQVVLASNQGYKVPATAELAHCSEHHVRAIIKDFNERGLKALEPKPHPGRPNEFTEDDNGIIDDVRIYDIGLSTEEIQELYENGISEPANMVSLEIVGPDNYAEESQIQYKTFGRIDWAKESEMSIFEIPNFSDMTIFSKFVDGRDRKQWSKIYYLL
jgi:hypothetical protein